MRRGWPFYVSLLLIFLGAAVVMLYGAGFLIAQALGL